jgi:hypothetical protein
MEFKNNILKPVLLGLTYLVLTTGCSSNQHTSNQQNFNYQSYQVQEKVIRMRNERTRFFLQTAAGMKNGTVQTHRQENGYVVIEGDGASVKSRSYKKACHQADTNRDGFVSPSEARRFYHQTIENKLK